LPDISILFDRSETDELGIRKTADEMGIELGFLPFYKVSIGFDENNLTYKSVGKNYTKDLNITKVVLNRTQSKSRRIYATTVLEAAGKRVLNPSNVELTCQSKLRTLLTIRNYGIRIPKSVYVPCNPKELSFTNNMPHDNTDTICELIRSHINDESIVLKPDAGTHGRGISLAENSRELFENVSNIESSIINPVGVLAQELIPKWFFDLRIITSKEAGKKAHCAENVLVRAGFKDFRTNTFLGNMVFRAKLPEKTRFEAAKCGASIAGTSDAWVIALDAMPVFGEDKIIDDSELIHYFSLLEEPFSIVKKVKKSSKKKIEFDSYTEEIELAYSEYMSTEAYIFIQDIIQDSLDRIGNDIVFHEGNSCPEFWEQTRIVAWVNVAEYLLEVAESILDSGEIS
jgi:glutathione synthase/RimK-type ligase-like ATP-grasp enzyme